MRLVEVAGEADLVADLHAVGLVPGVGGVGQSLAPQEGVDAAGLLQRDLLGIAQVGVRLVLHHGGPAVDGGREPAAQGVSSRASLVDFLDDGRRVLAALAVLFELLEFGGLVDAVGVGALDAQRPLDRDLPVAEGGVVENLALLALLEVKEGVTDTGDVVLRQLAVLLAQVLAQGLGTTAWHR